MGATQACHTKARPAVSSFDGKSGGPILRIDTNYRRWIVTILVSAVAELWAQKDFDLVGMYYRITILLPRIRSDLTS